ncbi:hypothetical protein [Chryseobacterium sp.]|uniref:hypothetical protein n=1 Tax=Chryseobacterium sp. TaxID=1871047 RepID=UPI0011CCACA6|nr:hypothetical protein [Chryseobacterium sp.]TXF77228.1 hypothetical protein FUA25_04620 [Chryseobacterium sp.]
MKNLLLLLFCFQASLFFGQTKFSNEKLSLVNDIVHKTTRQTVSSFMKDKGFGDAEVDEGTSEYGDLLYFEKTYNEVEVEYTTDGKIDNVVLTYGGAPNNTFIEMELRDMGFIPETSTGEWTDGKMKERKEWTKAGSKYSFITVTIEEEKIGILGYGTKE